jgi:uncharacterized membrane protein
MTNLAGARQGENSHCQPLKRFFHAPTLRKVDILPNRHRIVDRLTSLTRLHVIRSRHSRFALIKMIESQSNASMVFQVLALFIVFLAKSYLDNLIA